MKRFNLTYLLVIACIMMMTGCGVSTSSDQNGDGGSSGGDDGSISLPWDGSDGSDVATDPSDEPTTPDEVAPDPTPAVDEDEPLEISPAGPDLDDGTVGVAYDTLKIRAHGGSENYLMTLEGDLPPGLIAKCGAHECVGAEEVETVKIMGTPTTAGSFDFSITIEDMKNAGSSLKQGFTIDITSGVEALPGSIKLAAPDIIAKPIAFTAMSIIALTPPEDRAISISDIATEEGKEGELPYAKSIDLKIVGGSPEYTWNDPIVFGDANIEPDASDSSKATLHVTKVFPTLGAGQTVHAFIRVNASDAQGKHASAKIDIPITYPRATLEDMEVVGCRGNACSSMGVNTTFFDRHDEIIAQWTIWLEGPGKLVYTPDVPVDTPLSKIDRIRITGCSGEQGLENDLYTVGCLMPPSLDYTSIIFRTPYWEAVYPKHLKQEWNDSSITIFYLEDVMADMEGYEEAKPQAIWRPRIDNLPRPPVEQVEDGPIGKATNTSTPTPAEGESCFLSDDMRSEGYTCVDDEVGLADGCPMLAHEIAEGYRCIEGCVFAPGEVTLSVEQFIEEDRSTGKATICVGL